MKKMDERVSFRDGRYYIKDTNIRVDLVVGLGVKEILENYPWLSEDQIFSALDFAKEVIEDKGRNENSQKQISAL